MVPNKDSAIKDLVLKKASTKKDLIPKRVDTGKDHYRKVPVPKGVWYPKDLTESVLFPKVQDR